MASEDAYTAGQLSQLLHQSSSQGSPPGNDTALASLFTARPDAEPPRSKRMKLAAADKQQQDKMKKKKKLQQQKLAAGIPPTDEEIRATAKARVKLAKVREKARTEDPRNGRTVFVGNVSSAAKKRDLLVLFRQHGPIESVRFRSAAPADAGVIKRLAVIHKKLSRPSLNAYIVYKEPESVAKAIEALNGHCLSGMHLRVDCLPGCEGFHKDNNRCVFLGNLRFACDEESVRSAFAQCGRITNVRLVRDSRTGIGRGFGFVQFADAAAVELALKLAGTDVGGRPARVTRCAESSSGKGSSSERQQQQNRSAGLAARQRPAPELAAAANKKPPKKEKKRKLTRPDDEAAGSRRTDRQRQAPPSKAAAAAAAKARSASGSRPTNRTFAQAFQRRLDKRRAGGGGGGGNGSGKKPALKGKHSAS